MAVLLLVKGSVRVGGVGCAVGPLTKWNVQ
jgi:hypothetical protein